VLLLAGGEQIGAFQPDLRLTATRAEWEGIERGAGRLRARRVRVAVGGRRAGGRFVTHELFLPAPFGGIEVATETTNGLVAPTGGLDVAASA
jgi:hypothetical protein